MSLFKSVGELCDVVSLLVYCPNDGTIMLTLEGTSSECSIPCSKLSTDNSWYDQVMTDAQEIFGSTIRISQPLRVCKVWIPRRSTCIFHSVFVMHINDDQKKKLRSTGGIVREKTRWVNEHTLQKMLEQQYLKSPEITEFMRTALGEKSMILLEIKHDIEDVCTCPPLFEYSENLLVEKLSHNSEFFPLIKAAGFDTSVQTELYKEFVTFCFPFMYMSIHTFIRFCLNLDFSREEGRSLFYAADLTDRGGVSFRELLYIIAALDPNVADVESAAELRSIYIFRYFDSNKDGLLSFIEFRNLLAVIYKAKHLQIDSESFNKEVKNSFKAVINSHINGITMPNFVKAVAEMKIHGISQLLRARKSVFEYLQSIQKRDNSQSSLTQVTDKSSKLLKDYAIRNVSKQVSKQINTGAILEIQPFLPYELATHMLTLYANGEIKSADDIWTMQQAVSVTSMDQKRDPIMRRGSMDHFNPKSLSNELLKTLRTLAQLNWDSIVSRSNKNKQAYNWGQFEPAKFARSLIILCNQARDIMAFEPRLLQVSSPAYVLGDLHGNFADLMFFEKVLWQLGPRLSPCRMLFLGDYVDRGAHGMEVMTYLLCHKVQSPHNVLLLRGNHEIREIQMMFSFQTEIFEKFGSKLGAEVWNAINNAFDTMPIAAVLDSKVFCCHGGIPPPWLCPVASEINSIPVPLSRPVEESSLAWNLMWNDPMKQSEKQMSQALLMELINNEGFATNTRRGTAYMFTTQALENFLSINGFSHIIRAHEVAQAGFNIQQNAKLVTIFSSSRYCGGSNDAACVLADQGKLRFLRLETFA